MTGKPVMLETGENVQAESEVPSCHRIHFRKVFVHKIYYASTLSSSWQQVSIDSGNGTEQATCLHLNTLRPGHDGCHFGRQHFQIQICQIYFFSNSTKMSLKFVSQGPINNIPVPFRKRFGAEQTKSHYLNQWLYSLRTHIYLIELTNHKPVYSRQYSSLRLSVQSSIYCVVYMAAFSGNYRFVNQLKLSTQYK